MSTAAVATLEQRAEELRDRLARERQSLTAHERGALRTAREELDQAESIASGKRQTIAALESELSDIGTGLRILRGGRAIADNPQA